MKANPMNAKVVTSSSEAVLLDLLEGQPPNLVAALTRNLRTRQAIRWRGPEIHRAPFVVHRTAPDGGKSVESINDLIAEGKIRWDSRERAFVSRPDDPATYTIPSEDDELPEMLEHADVPEVVLVRLREHLAQTEPSLPGDFGEDDDELSEVLDHPDVLPAVRDRLPRYPDRPKYYKLTAGPAASTVRLVHPSDGSEILVHRHGEDDICSIQLVPPLPEVGEEARLVLADRPINLVDPFSINGFARAKYSDIQDAITGVSEWSIKRR